MTIVRRVLTKADGTQEVYVPHRNRDNHFVVARKTTSDPVGHASNQILVADEQQLVDLLRTGEYHLRMSPEGTSGPANLIAPGHFEILEETANDPPRSE